MNIMNKKFSKGQSAIEYLMNYAWAIALIIIVGVAIFGLDIGGIKSAIQGSGSKIRAAGQTVAVTDWVWNSSASSNDNFTIVVQNNGANKITFLNATIFEVDGTTILGLNVTSCGSTLFPGEKTPSCIINTTQNKNAGNTYSLKVRITYNNTDTGISHSPEYKLDGSAENL